MRVVLLLVDALRHDYISEESLPLLFDFSKKNLHYKRVVPSAGFCERTEIFFGLEPIESGFFTAIGYKPESSPYKAESRIIKSLGFLEFYIKNVFGDKASRIYRRIIFKLFKKDFNKKLKPYNIPLSFLKYFNLTEDESEFTVLNFENVNSLPELAFSRGIITMLDAFTSLNTSSNLTDSERVDIAINLLKENENCFIPVYLSELDSKGHLFGPDSEEFNNCLKDFDIFISEVIDRIQEIDKNITLIVLGDHGMSQVEKVINVEETILKIAKDNNLKLFKDYIYFLDSTIFRLWYFSENAKDVFSKECIKNEALMKGGKIVTEQIAREYSIPINDRKYGDFLWWADNNVLIFPDFFHAKSPMKGMHGYMPTYLTSHGTCVISGIDDAIDVIDEIKLRDVYKIIRQLILDNTVNL